MTMYKELIKRLREIHPDEFGDKWDFAFACQQAMHEAADALEELQKNLKRLQDFEAFWQHEAEETLKKFQVSISNKPHWIPVTERLPKKDQEVLVCLFRDNPHIAWHDGEYWCTEDFRLDEPDDWQPTHWMPLPEPPESESE